MLEEFTALCLMNAPWKLFHAVTAMIRACVQVISVGDFLQLKPVQGNTDDGAMMYYSKLFAKQFPHTIELTIIYRLK